MTLWHRTQKTSVQLFLILLVPGHSYIWQFIFLSLRVSTRERGRTFLFLGNYELRAHYIFHTSYMNDELLSFCTRKLIRHFFPYLDFTRITAIDTNPNTTEPKARSRNPNASLSPRQTLLRTRRPKKTHQQEKSTSSPPR